MSDIEEFLKHNDWYSVAYLERSAHRFWTFKAALNILLQRNLTNIVETGTTRNGDDWGAGMSTTLFGSFCKKYGKHMWTVDIDAEAIRQCQSVTNEYKDVITYTVNDSVAFLGTFNQEIHLLYLDSFDCPEYDASDSPLLLESQEHQLKEIKAAESKLIDGSVILLDDSGFENGGKARLTRNFLRENGWMEIINQQQSLWIKK